MAQSSVAIDAGANNAAVNTDLAGNARNDGTLDVGTYEFITGETTVTIADVTGYLDPSNPLSGLVGTQIGGKEVWSAYQTAQHIARYQTTWADLRDGSAATDLNVTYGFVLGTTNPTGVSLDFGPGQMEMARQVYQYISEISAMTFTETTGGTADLNLVNQDTANGGGAANLPNEGNGFVGVGGRGSTTLHFQYGSYQQHLLFHEGAGHALGLLHPGPYNGYGYSYAATADHWNDSRQYTQMSYWSAAETGGLTSSLSTMGLHDILAMQIEYGANMASNTGNDTYGYNASVAGGVYDFTTGVEAMGFSIWDAAGIDTLDFSGSSVATQMDLREGSFSTANGWTHNVSIAYGAVVENAVGSRLDDEILGNTVSNLIHGGQGHDVIRGGLDAVPTFAVDPRHFIGIELNRDPLVRDQFLQVDNVQSLSGSAFTIEMMVDIIRVPNNGVQFASYAVSGSTNEFRIATPGNSGTIQVYINGVAYDTTIPTETLMDGQPHRLSVSWDSTTGALNTYIDGALANSGTHQPGAPLAIGGTLIFGQDQDTVGGGFQAQEAFQGTIGDIRIFDDVRSAAEITSNHFTTLTGNEANLANNWQVQAGDTTTVTDVAVANPSVNLTDLLPTSFTASQSSSYNASSGAGLVLDNDTNTWNHTLNTGNEWLLLTFDQPRDITTVSFQNRPTWGSRLDGTTVSVLDAAGNVLYTSAPIAGAANAEVFSFTFPSALSASSIRIDQTQNFLHIAELNVFGLAPAGVRVAPALLNTDFAIHNGISGTSASVRDTTPIIDTTPDNDTIYGEQGNDVLRGGWGDDTLYGHGGNTALDSPFAATTAIALNQGANDQYLEIANYDGISGAANSVQFTIEMLIGGLSTGYTPLLSYAHSGSSNGFLVEVGSNGNFNILNFGTGFGAGLDTGISAAGLTDGDLHRFSISWDGTSATSEYVIYIDGVETGRGTHPRQFWQVNSGGTLIFGQEQDALGGGFQSSQIISGNIGDIRVFNDIRTQAEIADNVFAPIANPANEQGLINNWQVDSASIANGALTDATGGTSLTITAPTTPVTTTAIGNWDNDILIGGLGNDTLYGGRGSDQLFGDGGNDVLGLSVHNSGDLDVLDGGSGVDTANFSAYGQAVWVSLGYAGIEAWNRDFSATLADLNGIENITGTAFNDRLIGDTGDNILSYTGGFDTFLGSTGSDTANFSAYGQAIWVDLGYAGIEAWNRDFSSILVDLNGIENITGTAFNDRLIGDTGDNILSYTGGFDTFLGSTGSDTANFSAYGQAIWVDLGYAGIEAWSRDFSSILVDLNGIENITGTAFNDRLIGDTGDNILSYTGGFDSLLGGTGSDTADFSTYDQGVWVSLGYAGFEAWNRDFSTILSDLDSIENITGSAFDDRLIGDAVANILAGDLGADTLSGGDESDSFIFGNLFGTDTITDWDDTGSGFEDLIDFSTNDSVNAWADISSNIDYSSGSAVITVGGDTITLTNVTSNLDAGDFIF